jgi:glycosyltransferase 2 family protein
VVRLAFLLPLPGGIGSVEAGLFWAFQALALPLPAAAALIVLMRLRDVIILLTGAALLPGLQSTNNHSTAKES